MTLIGQPNILDTKVLISQIQNDSILKQSYNKKTNEELKTASQDFESIFIQKILTSMRKTIPKSDFLKGGMAEEIFTSMQDMELAKTISRKESFGLSKMIYSSLSSVHP